MSTEYIDIREPIPVLIQRSVVTKVLREGYSEWVEYTDLILTMREAEERHNSAGSIVAFQNGNGVIYDIVLKKAGSNPWCMPIEQEETKSDFRKQIYEIQQDLHKIDQALDEIRANAKDTL